ncbi:DUF2911 domain-containing protein [Aurantibacter crassamenti]|uniref:DUF2911 domain-containing protein n=1 Tax=Aurantibacter crassamenti TaxID=1837375 RepID=UPI0019398E95|nr:DUF2911 domain-containing protein [Aurantibacter crassamenti]MBM1106853.1 DUF2911 domain-containing protein [Aurantibacter crassamenti]
MKKITLLLCVAMVSFTMNAQIEAPAPSPSSTLIQNVGLTDVTVEYSRPSMRGRTIFGDLVPFDKIWRTGANARTKITFNKDVTFGGTAVKAGSYAVFTKPSATSWEVYLYDEPNAGGTPKVLDESKVAAKVTSEVVQMPMSMETFTIIIDDLSDNGATLGFLWESTYVPVKIGVATDEAVMKSIDKVMAGPNATDYYSAAVYYMNSGKDINKAKEWIDKSMSMTEKPAFWQLRQQSLIYAKSGDKKGAIAAAKKSLEAAKVAGNDDYVKMNTDSLKEWGAK